jgi:hypothetical protein
MKKLFTFGAVLCAVLSSCTNTLTVQTKNGTKILVTDNNNVYKTGDKVVIGKSRLDWSLLDGDVFTADTTIEASSYTLNIRVAKVIQVD